MPFGMDLELMLNTIAKKISKMIWALSLERIWGLI